MKKTYFNKPLSLVLAVIMILSALPLTAISSFAATSGDWEYSVSNNKATITKYKGTASKVTIPSKLGGYSVTSIGDYAFFYYTLLTGITIPNCVTSIGNYAFEGCALLTSIKIPDSVTSIGYVAFCYCTSLTSVTIGNSVISIGDFAFDGCTSLKSFNVDSNNQKYFSANGVLFNKDKSELILYPEGKRDKQYSIPNSVTSIGDRAFYDCTSLTGVTIPNSVTSIGVLAFPSCTSLTSVTIPDSVTSIGDYAFYDCTSLTSVTIGNSVTSIGYGVFNGCTSLKSFNVDSNNQKYFSANGVLFNKDKSELILYPEGKRDKQYSIPNSVTSIGDYALYDCTSLTSVTIPNSVTSIGYYAFLGCTSLTSIVIPESVKSIEEYAYGYWDDSYSKIKGASIVGVKGSEAERYAKANNIPFYEIGTFPDVKQGSWYYDSVYYVSKKGYITGYANGKFGPSDNLKRQDFVCILARIANADLSKYANMTSKLSDVKKGAYYAASVNWAVDNGIISGYQNGNFGVNDNITREQVATILYRYMGSPEIENIDSTLAKFKDVNRISSFAKTAVAWAVQNNVISGMADGRVAPTEGAARAQIASIIMRMDQQGMFNKA